MTAPAKQILAGKSAQRRFSSHALRYTSHSFIHSSNAATVPSIVTTVPSIVTTVPSIVTTVPSIVTTVPINCHHCAHQLSPLCPPNCSHCAHQLSPLCPVKCCQIAPHRPALIFLGSAILLPPFRRCLLPPSTRTGEPEWLSRWL